MPEGVKSSSQRRGQARTRLARRAVIDAARSLFIEGGYATTTIATISRRADVPEPTVYRLFSSKLGILKALLDASIAGDDEPIAVQGRPSVAWLFGEPDPHKVLAGFAAVTTQINQRTNDLYSVLSRADSDGEAALLVGTLREQRDPRARADRASTAPQAKGPPCRTEGPRRGRPCARTHVSRGLPPPVTDRGWSPDRYQQWAADTLIQQLT